MPRFISITKAASLANVHAQEIQEKISSNQLASTRGQIHLDDLLACYPQAKIEQADMLALVEKIKEESFESGAAKQNGELSYSALKNDLEKSKTNARYYREQSAKFEVLVMHVRENLLDIQAKGVDEKRIQRLIDWIEKRIIEVQRND